MANSALIQASLQFTNGTTGASAALTLQAVSVTVVGDHYQACVFSVPTTAGGTAIPLGGVTSPGGLLFVKNLSGTNYLDILTAVGGVAFLRLNPGEAQLIRLNPAITAPAAMANPSPVELQYLLLDA